MSKYSLTIDHTKVPSSLTDFPVYVNLNDVISGMTTAQANSIRVYKADGVTEVAREIVSQNEMHFLADSLSSSSDTVFVIDIDGARSDYLATDTYGRNNVWSDYAAVWHLDENPTGAAPQAIDATGYGNDLSSTSGMTQSTGKIDKAIEFTGSPQVYSAGSIASGNPLMMANSTMSISFWVYYTGGTSYPRIIEKATGGLGVDGYTIWLTGNFAVSPNIQGRIDNSNTFDGSPFPKNTWVHHHWVLDGDKRVSLYKDGSFDTKSSVLKFPPNKTANFTVGNWYSGDGRQFEGLMDEVRILATPLSSDWIATEYNNQNSPSTFYSLSELHGSVQGVASIQGATSIVL